MSARERKIWQVVLLFAVIILGYILDQLSKFIAENGLTRGESISVIKNIFHITLVHNTGAAFGILRSCPYLFIMIAILSAVFMCVFLWFRHKKLLFFEKLALSFILSGTIGNLTDRLRFGYVIDFIDFRVWPVFNLADSFITLGVGILIVSMLLTGWRKDKLTI